MKFAKKVGMPLSIAGLFLCIPPVQTVLSQLFGETGPLVVKIIFASGWALLLGYLAFNLGVESQNKISE